MKISHILLGLLMVLCFSIDAIFVKNSLSYLNSYFFCGLRFAIVAIIFLPFLKNSKPSWILFFGAFGLAVLNIAGRDMSLKLNNSLFVSELIGQCDLIVSISFALLIFKEKFTKKHLLGFFIALIGFISIVILNIFSDLEVENFSKSISISNLNQDNFIAILFLMLGWLGWPIFICCVKHYENKYKVTQIIGWTTLIGSIQCFAISLIYPNYSIANNILYILENNMIIKIIIAGLIGLLIPISIWIYLGKKYKYYQISTFVLISPFLTAILGYFILGQKLTPPFIIAGLILIFGIYLNNSCEKDEDKAKLKKKAKMTVLKDK